MLGKRKCVKQVYDKRKCVKQVLQKRKCVKQVQTKRKCVKQVKLFTSVKVSENVKLFFLGPKTVQNLASRFGANWPKSVHKKKNAHIYFFTKEKLSPTFLWVSKFDVKLWLGEHHFRNYSISLNFQIFGSKLVIFFR